MVEMVQSRIYSSGNRGKEKLGHNDNKLQRFTTLYVTYNPVCISFCFPLSQIFSGTWKWDVSLIKTVAEVITFCLVGYSVRSWSRPPKGTAPLLLEGRQQASMSRL